MNGLSEVAKIVSLHYAVINLIGEAMDEGRPLYWDTSYEIVLALVDAHPDVDIETVGTKQLYEWVIALPNFADDVELVNEGLLNAILQEWYEEVSAT